MYCLVCSQLCGSSHGWASSLSRSSTGESMSNDSYSSVVVANVTVFWGCFGQQTSCPWMIQCAHSADWPKLLERVKKEGGGYVTSGRLQNPLSRKSCSGRMESVSVFLPCSKTCVFPFSFPVFFVGVRSIATDGRSICTFYPAFVLLMCLLIGLLCLHVYWTKLLLVQVVAALRTFGEVSKCVPRSAKGL